MHHSNHEPGSLVIELSLIIHLHVNQQLGLSTRFIQLSGSHQRENGTPVSTPYKTNSKSSINQRLCHRNAYNLTNEVSPEADQNACPPTRSCAATQSQIFHPTK